MTTNTDRVVREYHAEISKCLSALTPERVAECVEVLVSAWNDRRTVYVCGNGGSASTASHVVCDLNKGAAVPGVRPLRVVGLTDNVSHMTALANDIDYSEVFRGQLFNWLDPGDVVIGISASGNSPNCVAAFEFAREVGATTMGWLGFDGGAMLGLSDVAVHLPSGEYGPVEDGHLMLNHMVTVAMRERFRAMQEAEPGRG